MKKICWGGVLILVLLSGCATIDKSKSIITIQGTGINDSNIVEAHSIVVNGTTKELR